MNELREILDRIAKLDVMFLAIINDNDRKTVATSALRKGMAIDQVQKMLGHSDIKTTTIYAQTLEDDVKTAHSKYVG